MGEIGCKRKQTSKGRRLNEQIEQIGRYMVSYTRPLEIMDDVMKGWSRLIIQLTSHVSEGPLKRYVDD